MEALSISDEEYDRHHTRRSSTTGELTDSSLMLKNGDGSYNYGEELTQLEKSVYLATGIHHPVITEDDLEDLPRRFDTVAGGTKARFTWFGALCMAGIGMFVEAYIIITTGQIKSIWHVSYPECWGPSQYQRCPENIQCCGLFPNTPANNETGVCEVATDASFSAMCDSATGYYKDSFQCNQAILGSISYSEFAGLMLGMVSFGFIADLIGINKAGMLSALLSVVGVTLMTFYSSDDLTTQFLMYSIFFGLFGLGVGGEYPLTAAGAAQHHHDTMAEAQVEDAAQRQIRILRDKERTARRGETIGMVFAMQGIGAVVGSAFLLVLIYFSKQGYPVCDRSIEPGANSEGVDAVALNTVWRAFLLIGLIFVLGVLLYRWLVIEENEEGIRKLRERKSKRGDTKLTLGRIFSFYGVHVVATGGCWFLWDIAFYGLKLFSGPIFDAINPSGGLLVNNGYLLINNLLALIGYYVCSMIIDYPRVGRRNVQTVFFVLVSIVFLIMSVLFDSLSPSTLIVLFFLSSVLGQFVNVTTYVMAAETYPAELRGTLHGLSAFLGKSGALVATVVFGTIQTEHIFLICGITGLFGAALTYMFSIDMTHVSLSEHDAQLELYLEGRVDEYKGLLNKPCHLSNFQRLTGLHGEYDPDWARKFVIRESAGRASKKTRRECGQLEETREEIS